MNMADTNFVDWNRFGSKRPSMQGHYVRVTELPGWVSGLEEWIKVCEKSCRDFALHTCASCYFYHMLYRRAAADKLLREGKLFRE
jgi:hypothetical protein